MTQTEQQLKLRKIQTQMAAVGVKSLLLRSIPAFLYLSDTVMQGFIFVPLEGNSLWFLERASSTRPPAEDDRVFAVRKPEDIPAILARYGYSIDEGTALELGQMPVTDFVRLSRLSASGCVSDEDGSQILRTARILKTETELRELRRLAKIHTEVSRSFADLYRPGMTDRDWQHEIEYRMRRSGSIGIFRAFGWRMEIFQGNLITGDSAAAPAPYDFAMGGKGTPAFPFGSSGTPIRPGQTVMVDMAGNYGSLLTDMTRTYALGDVSPMAQKAHELSIRLHEWFATNVKPGFPIAEVYNHCIREVDEAGLGDCFMGTPEWRGKFVGHGLGLEINEPPVLTARWHGVFEENMAIAFEPKFVIPDVGPAGVENTYIITAEGVENITPLPMDLIPLPEN